MDEKIERLMTILTEAKSIMGEIDAYIELEMKKYKTLSAPYNEHINTLEVGPRETSLFRRFDIVTIGDLVLHNSPLEVLKDRNVGKKTVKNIKEALKRQYDIDWK